MNKMYVATLALVLAGALLPTTGALELVVNPPLAAIVTIDHNMESPQARPAWSGSPGWECWESIPWEPFPTGERSDFEVSCRPDRTTESIASWSCRNPAVEGEGWGQGYLTVTAWCDGGPAASCTAKINGHGVCHDLVSDFEKGTPPLRCRVTVSSGVYQWHARCYNDP